MTYRVYICGDGPDCPHDPAYEHRFFFGCVPKNFSERSGRARGHRQDYVEIPGYGVRCRWNGGCDAAGVIPTRWGPPNQTPTIILEMR